MKRSRSPSPTQQGGLFSSGQPNSSRTHPEKKSRTEPKEVIEKEPCVVSGDLYIIRKITLGDKPGSLLMELDSGLGRSETGILHAALRHLNDLRERATLGQRQPRLYIKLKAISNNDYLINVTAIKQEDMDPFIYYLEQQHHISKATAEDILVLFEQSYQLSPSSGAESATVK